MSRRFHWQPLYRDHNGDVRFKSNVYVKFLLDNGPITLNHLTGFGTKEDWFQFLQLIGQSEDACREWSLPRGSKKRLKQASGRVGKQCAQRSKTTADYTPRIVPRIPTCLEADEQLLWMIVEHSHRPSASAVPRARWMWVAEKCGINSAHARVLCNRFGFNPDEMV